MKRTDHSHCPQFTRPIRSSKSAGWAGSRFEDMPGPTFLSAEQVLLTTLVVKLAVMAALATMLVRYRRFRHILIFERRDWPDRLVFALALGVPLAVRRRGAAAAQLLRRRPQSRRRVPRRAHRRTVRRRDRRRHGRPAAALQRRDHRAAVCRSAAASPAADSASSAPRKPSGTSRRSSSRACTGAPGGWCAASRSTGRWCCCSRRSRWRCSARRSAPAGASTSASSTCRRSSHLDADGGSAGHGARASPRRSRSGTTPASSTACRSRRSCCWPPRSKRSPARSARTSSSTR